MYHSLIFCAVFLLCQSPLAAQPGGDWYALLDAMGTELPLRVTFTGSDDGDWQGQLVSPSQGGQAIAMTSVGFDGKRLTFEVAPIGAKFSGAYGGTELSGIFSQAGMDFPLVFTRHRPAGYPVEEGPITIRSRAQDPTDFPYHREEVTFRGGADSVRLAGELTAPRDTAARAVVVLISGSGPQDRNQYLGTEINHSTFLVLSDFLTRRGYAVLRYDDRGVAASTGDYATATSADLAQDAWAAVRYLRERPDYRDLPVGLAGHSEGGLIAPMVAAADGALDFTILLAAPGVPIDSLMLDQRRRVYAAMNLPAAAVARDEPSLRAAYAWIKANPQLKQEDYVEGLYRVFAEQLDNLPAPLRKSITDERAYNQPFVDALRSPWMRYFIGFDPRVYLDRHTVPTLAINGTSDTQIAAEPNLNGIAESLARAGNPDVTIVPLLGLNHLFQRSETGSPTEYGTIETTIEPEVLTLIADWLDARF